jgi:hypothetical protein
LQDFLNKYPFVVIPFFILFWCALLFLIAALTGWMRLARGFRETSTFTGPIWGCQSARMRWGSHYGSCLNVGADVMGLKLSVLFLFRPFHPPLFIPWSEIAVGERGKVLLVRRVKLLLGREEPIPFVISATLADRIQAAAAGSWPIEASREPPGNAV